MIVKEALKYGIKNLQNIDEPILNSRMVLAFILNIKKEDLILKDDYELKPKQEKAFKKAIYDLVNGKPVQYIIKKQEFMKLDFYVDENVLIPRQDTEILVEEILKLDCSKTEILDLCTGSGAIGVSLAKNLELSKITMSDINRKALKIAIKNARQNLVDLRTKFIYSNMFDNIKSNFDIIVSNPPYIETEIINTLSEQVKNEPVIALDGGIDGLIFYRNIINNSYKFLKQKGYLCFEIGYNQKEKIFELLNNIDKYENIVCKKDLANNDRCIICRSK